MRTILQMLKPENRKIPAHFPNEKQFDRTNDKINEWYINQEKDNLLIQVRSGLCRVNRPKQISKLSFSVSPSAETSDLMHRHVF